MSAPASRRRLLGGLAVLPLVGTAALPAEPHPDAELLALGERLRAAWAAEVAAPPHEEYEAAFEVSHRIVDLIELLPATTHAGLRVKAMALSWCYSGEPVVEEEIFGTCTTTNVQLSAGIVRDRNYPRGLCG